MRSPEKLKPEEQEQLTFLRQVHPSLDLAYNLVQTFLEMVRKREGEKLEAWLEQIRTSQIPELIRFANGIERDKAPVQAALTLQYSNGPVEEKINKLKYIKRSMYGRSAFPLLRQKVLKAA